MSITLVIIVVTVAVSIPAFSKPSLFYRYDFSPYQIEQRKEWYRFLTHGFIHADWAHLIFNMLVLFFFGDVTQHYFEAYLGTKGILYFLILYVGGMLFAVLPTYKKQRSNPSYHSVGASGAVAAVLFSSVIFNPMASICLWGVLCFPGIIWAILYLAYSIYQSKQANDNINHEAHLWGAIFGVVATLILVPKSLNAFLYQLAEVFF
jgi:membrane associated rhomboid family serine protease